VLGNTPYE